MHTEFERKGKDGVKLYFQCWQAETPPKGVICLEHGLGEHSGRYAVWAEKLNQAGYIVIALDLRGHGKSGGQRGHVNKFDEYLDDTDLLLHEAKDRDPGVPVFLYGHSMGAIIAWVYAMQRKPKLTGVILTALDYRNALEEQKAKVWLSKILGAIVPRFAFSSGLNPNDISRDHEIVHDYINDPLVHNKASAGWAKSCMDAIAWALPHSNEWSLPVLVMHGELDKLGYAIGSREFAGKVKADCTLKIWTGLSHEIHNEPEKDQVFEFLRQWLDAHTVVNISQSV